MTTLRTARTLVMALAIGLTAPVVAGGCSSDPVSGPLCDWLAKPNCWAAAVDATAGCRAPAGEVAVLTADRTSCTFTNGVHIAFDPPPPASFGSDGWSPDVATATITASNGQPCVTAHIDLTTTGGVEADTFTTSTGQVTFDIYSQVAVEQVVCPDKSTSPAQTTDATACSDKAPSPTIAGAGTTVAVGMSGAGPTEVAWRCKLAP